MQQKLDELKELLREKVSDEAFLKFYGKWFGMGRMTEDLIDSLDEYPFENKEEIEESINTLLEYNIKE